MNLNLFRLLLVVLVLAGCIKAVGALQGVAHALHTRAAEQSRQ